MMYYIIFIIVGLFIFDKPPITCFTICTFNKYMRKLYTLELMKIESGKPLASYNTKDLKRIHRWTSKFSCREMNDSDFNRYKEVRDKIKNEIADRELLG